MIDMPTFAVLVSGLSLLVSFAALMIATRRR